ncbi:hypothetical protein AB5J72_07095 [Streptomyces sp. CG1]|uniref:hypothetical protein n=1 Tax=Streptomyces sp. CG1 TaxID=1287523 RepID=UPI0034E1AC98
MATSPPTPLPAPRPSLPPRAGLVEAGPGRQGAVLPGHPESRAGQGPARRPAERDDHLA